MTQSVVKVLSFGDRFWFASLLYIGLGLLVLGIAPDVPNARAAAPLDCPAGMTAVLVGEVYECQCVN